MPFKVWPTWYSRSEITITPGLFVFGDNMMKKGTKGQAIIRGLPNAYGIPTKFFPSADDPAAFFYDKYSQKFDDSVIFHFCKLEQKLQRGDLIYWPKDGIGTGLAKWQETAPKFLARINAIVKEFKERYP